MAFVVDGRVGTKLTHEDTTANHLLRARVPTDEGDYVYGRAQGDLTTAMWVTMLPGGTCRAALAGNVIFGEQVLVAVGSVTSANFGWFHANGRNIHGRVAELGTLQTANAASMLFMAIDSGEGGAAGFIRWSTVGLGSTLISTVGSLNRAFFPQLAMARNTTHVNTGATAIFEHAGDIYGVHMSFKTTLPS